MGFLKNLLLNKAGGQAYQKYKEVLAKIEQVKKTIAVVKAIGAFLAAIGPILFPLLLAVFIGFMIFGYKVTEAEENHRGINVSDTAHQEYLSIEATTYSKETDDNHSYKDEFQFRLPWAVLEELDSSLFDGKDTLTYDSTGQYIEDPSSYIGTDTLTTIVKKDFMKEAVEALGPQYGPDSRYDNDIYTTYTYEQTGTTTVSDGVDENGNPKTKEVPVYEWVEHTKTVKRHIIYSAQTWNGTYSRTYEQVTHAQTPPASPSPGDSYTVNKIWEFQSSGEVYEPSPFATFVKSEGPKIMDSNIKLMIDVIYMMLDMDNPVDDDGPSDVNGNLNFDPALIYLEGDFAWPTNSTRVTSNFGPRTAPGEGASTYHKGIDIGATKPGVDGDPVYAARDGVVQYFGDYGKGGNAIVLYHGTDASTPPKVITTKYMHLSRFAPGLSMNMPVKKGQIIGYMGNTGNSFGTHLHFEIRENDEAKNPLLYYGPIGSADIEEYIRKIPSNSAEMDLFIRLINAEGGGTGDMGIMGVAEVVLNRLRSTAFNYKPKTLYTVIYAKNQFEVVSKGTINNRPDDKQYERIKNLVNKVITEKTNYVKGATFFCSYPAGSTLEADYMRVNRLQFNGVQYGANRFYVPQSR